VIARGPLTEPARIRIAPEVIAEGMADLDHVAVDHTPGKALIGTQRWRDARLARLRREEREALAMALPSPREPSR
jgi:hypothetical protein